MNKQHSKVNEEPSSVTTVKSIDEIKTYMQERLRLAGGPEELLEQFKEIIPKAEAGEKLNEEEQKTLNKVGLMIGLDNQTPVGCVSSDIFEGLITNFNRDLGAEYDCQKPSEKALAQFTAIAYGKHLECSLALKRSTSIKSTSHEQNEYYILIGKELDRSSRRFLTGLQMLQQLKNPIPELNIKAKNAFISQNQQINSYEEPKQTKGQDEINSSK